MNRLENELRARRVDLPTAVFLSMRDDSNALLEDDEKSLRLRLAGHTLNVVDGQHPGRRSSALGRRDPERWSALQGARLSVSLGLTNIRRWSSSTW